MRKPFGAWAVRVGVACLCAVLAGCGHHLTRLPKYAPLPQTAVAQLKPGLSKAEVQALLGKPILDTPLNTNRWVYPYPDGQLPCQPTAKPLVLLFQRGRLKQIMHG